MNAVDEQSEIKGMSDSFRQQRVCSECVMDSSDPEIIFDSQGVCNHHKLYQSLVHKVELGCGEHAISRIIENIRVSGEGKAYDCVIGLSGGVDSSYLAKLCIDWKLRPLAVHLDNGWNSELAVSNIERIVKGLGIDLYTHVIDWNEFRMLQLAFLRASVPNAEIPTDHAIVGTLYRLAREHRIKYILSGSNLATESIMPAAWGYDHMDYRHLYAINKRFGGTTLNTYPFLSLKQFLFDTYIRRIKRIRPLNYVKYHKEEAVCELERKFGWRRYPGKHYESKFTQFFQAYILPTKFGYDKRRAHLSSLIMSSQMSRTEALKRLSQPLYGDQELQEDKEYVIKKLGISDIEFQEIMKLPIKSERDFPNNKLIFSVLRRMRDLFGA